MTNLVHYSGPRQTLGMRMYTNNFLVSLTAHESKESFRLNWIGGIFAHGLEEWTWEDTSPFDYSNFARGEGTAEPAKPEIFLEFNR